jgi:hypothetical protein
VSVTLVQKALNITGTFSTSASKAFPSNVTAGNSILVVVMQFQTGFTRQTFTLHDTLGNNYGTKIAGGIGSTSSTLDLEFYLCSGILGGANTVTASFSGSATWGIAIYELSGPTALDVSVQNLNDGTTNPTTGAAGSATSGSGDFALAAVVGENTPSGTTAGTGWTLDAAGSGSAVEEQTGVASGTTLTGNFIQSVTLTKSAVVMVALKVAAATFSISGNAGVAGASVALTGTSSGSTTADGSGNYSFTGLANGSYTVTPTLSGYTFSPTNQGETVSGSNITGVNFTATSTSPPNRVVFLIIGD